ncbi:MAG: DUF2007 domain-containing protein [Acidobacteriota bacterium]|nr:DUF2007 domain-containing protein [Acidobacteriota bacterium]MDH3784349.1 DUF2007 domain-containing protein [Acidobacteriota bacterium]
MSFEDCESPSVPWKVLIQTTDDFHLQLVCSLLGVAQIPHTAQGQSALRLYPLGAAGTKTTNRMLGATVKVPEDRLEEARALISEPAVDIEDPS